MELEGTILILFAVVFAESTSVYERFVENRSKEIILVRYFNINQNPCSLCLMHTILVLKWSKLGCTGLYTCIKLKFTELVNFADQGSRWINFVVQTFTYLYQIWVFWGFGIE